MSFLDFLADLSEGSRKRQRVAPLELTDEDEPGSEATNAKILEAVSKSSSTEIYGEIPDKYWNDALVDAIMDHPYICAAALLRFPDRFKTPARLDQILEQSPKDLLGRFTDVPADYLNNPKVILRIAKVKKNNVRYLLNLLKGHELDKQFWHDAVAANWKFARGIPQEYQTWRVMVKALVNEPQDKVLIANLKPAYRCKAMREAVTMLAEADPLCIDWEAIDALEPKEA